MYVALKLQCGRVTGNKKSTIGGLIYLECLNLLSIIIADLEPASFVRILKIFNYYIAMCAHLVYFAILILSAGSMVHGEHPDQCQFSRANSATLRYNGDWVTKNM